MRPLLFLTAALEAGIGLGLLAAFDSQSCSARGVVSAMVLYNVGAVVVLGAAGIQSQPVGIALWPAVILHTAMTSGASRAFWENGDSVFQNKSYPFHLLNLKR